MPLLCDDNKYVHHTPTVDLQWEAAELCQYNFTGCADSNTQQVPEKACMQLQHFCCFTNTPQA